MADQMPDSPNWLQSIGLMIGGGGIATVILEIIKRRLPSTEEQDKTSERYVDKLREDYQNLQTRFDTKEHEWQIREAQFETELRQERAINMQQLRINALLETENRQLRSRYHRIRDYCTVILGRLFAALGEEKFNAEVPAWVDEQVPSYSDAQQRALPEEQRG